MLYFTLKLSEEEAYSYEVDKISNNIKDFNTEDTIFYYEANEDLYNGDVIDFYELSDFGVYSGNVFKIIDSGTDIATVIDYDDIYDVQEIIYYETEKIIVKIDYLSYSPGRNLVSIQDRTGEILCDICEVDIPVYS
jgi:hypothetical protein